MKKNWLIRTKNNHLLGPVSKDKIKELISNSSIKGDDEICSGNGYWLYVREQDLVDKYIMGDEEQDFNPVQEAEPGIIADFSGSEETPEKIEEDVKKSTNILPEKEDLEYPDELVEDKPHCEVESELESVIPEETEDFVEDLDSLEADKTEVEEKVVKKSKLTLELIFILALIFLLIVVAAFKYKKVILESVISSNKISFFQSAIAQEIPVMNKKKTG